MFFNFKVLYEIQTRCHMVTFKEMASHTPKPLSLRHSRVQGSGFRVQGFYKSLFSMFFPNPLFTIFGIKNTAQFIK